MTDVSGDIEDLNDRIISGIIRAAKGAIPRNKNRTNWKMVHGGQKSVKRLSEIESEHWNTRLVHISGHQEAVLHVWLYSTRP